MLALVVYYWHYSQIEVSLSDFFKYLCCSIIVHQGNDISLIINLTLMIGIQWYYNLNCGGLATSRSHEAGVKPATACHQAKKRLWKVSKILDIVLHYIVLAHHWARLLVDPRAKQLTLLYQLYDCWLSWFDVSGGEFNWSPDVKLPESGGGYSYKESGHVTSPARNRFIYW